MWVILFYICLIRVSTFTMAFQGKILLIVALALFINKVRCEINTTQNGHMFFTRAINDSDEAPDQIDSDDEGDAPMPPPATPGSGQSNNSAKGTIYENLHSPEAMQLLTEEYVGLVETEIAAETMKEIMARVKTILFNKNSIKNFKQLRGEIYKYMTNPKTPNMVKSFLENRYKYYVDNKTPAFINEKFAKIRSFVNNKNIPMHIMFFRKMATDFLSQKDNVKTKIAEGFTLLSKLLSLPPIPFMLS